MNSLYRPVIVVALTLLAACGTPPSDVPGAAVPAGPQAQSVALRGTYWKLVELGGSPVAGSEEGREPSLVLAEGEDRVSGHGGCNRFSGSFTLSADKLSFSPLASTKMACLKGGDIESGYLLALAGVASYRLDGASLQLYDAGGGRVARFERAEPPAP